jgi:hypothetical protein
MKWFLNTENMVVKANKRLWILQDTVFGIYSMQIRSAFKLVVPAWYGWLNLTELNVTKSNQTATRDC